MKKHVPIFIIVLNLLYMNISCNKEEDNTYPPTIITNFANNVTYNSAIVGGKVTDDGGSEIIETGVYWDSISHPEKAGNKYIINNQAGIFSDTLENLLYGTTYFVSAYAINNKGESIGGEIDFITKKCLGCDSGFVTDNEGNNYKTVKIGEQWWMKENLAVTKYNDGKDIPLVTDDRMWTLTGHAYCWYNNEMEKYKETYGAMYNWFAVETGKLCPEGWHVPDSTELKELIDYLGGDNVAGSKMMESGIEDWWSPSACATNSSKFTALPGGIRDFHTGKFGGIGYGTAFWLSSEENLSYGDQIELTLEVCKSYRAAYYKRHGYYIRCIKN